MEGLNAIKCLSDILLVLVLNIFFAMEPSRRTSLYQRHSIMGQESFEQMVHCTVVCLHSGLALAERKPPQVGKQCLVLSDSGEFDTITRASFVQNARTPTC